MLHELIGLKVIETEVVFEYLQVLFEEKACLSVYNKYQIDNRTANSEDEQILVGSSLVGVWKDEQNIKLSFSNGTELLIDMSEDAYQGPEALQLDRPGRPTVVARFDD